MRKELVPFEVLSLHDMTVSLQIFIENPVTFKSSNDLLFMVVYL